MTAVLAEGRELSIVRHRSILKPHAAVIMLALHYMSRCKPLHDDLLLWITSGDLPPACLATYSYQPGQSKSAGNGTANVVTVRIENAWHQMNARLGSRIPQQTGISLCVRI